MHGKDCPVTMKPNALILCGDGINCERETAQAFNLANADVKIIHVNDLSPKHLERAQILALPGGFSFGDDLGSGQALAIKLQARLQEELKIFLEKEKPIIGICNGFQALARMGLLPYPFEKRTLALTKNHSGEFINSWVELAVQDQSPCIWTKKLQKTIQLPIRHGEGRVVFPFHEGPKIHNNLSQNGQIPLRYTTDVNGSFGRIAGICDPKGIVFGLMPHPEAACSQLLYPQSSSLVEKDRTSPGIGLLFFESCIEYVKGK